MIKISERSMSKASCTSQPYCESKEKLLKEIKSATLYCCYGKSCSETTVELLNQP